MAGQPGIGTSASATATLVGNAFVSQYYNVLHQSPHDVHRFYTDLSKLSRSEVGANADIVETQHKIQEKIMSMDLDGVQAEIKTVDSLASLNGSVLVMVTGLLSNRGGSQRNFVQTFFLAPQEKGYFVLSDICRFLDGVGDQPTQNVSDVIPEHSTVVNAVEQVHEVPVPSSNENVPDSLVDERELTDSLHKSVEKEKVYTPRDTPVEDDGSSIVDNALSDQQPVVARLEEHPPPVKEESFEGPTKMSYASVLRESSGGSSTTRQAGPRKAAPAQTVPVTPISVSQGATQATAAYSSDAAEEIVADGGDGYAVYVKNLPLTISQQDLENEFQKFGSVIPGGVTLRNQKQGVCFAFIQFDELSAAQSAIEASPISIGNRHVYVEEKKPTLTGPSAGRGRAGSGRGFQADGMNGRGNFGGRNFGRGGYNSERDFNSSRGRGGRANNYGSNGNSSNGFRRGDSQAGNATRPPRRVYTDQ